MEEEARKPIAYRPRALDGGYGWVVVLGSFLIHVFTDGFVYSFGVIAESLIQEFDSSNTVVSTILSLLTGLMLATGPLASAICNRIGCRITTIIGAIIASFGCAISYFATSMAFLIFSVGIVMGTGFGLMYCPAIVIVTIYFEKYRSLATGVTVCGAGVGTFIFSKIISILIVQFDWRTVFIIYAVLVLLCVPCGILYRPVKFVPIYEEELDEEKGIVEIEEESGIGVDEEGIKPESYQNGNAFQNNILRPAQSQQLINKFSTKTNGVLNGNILGGKVNGGNGGEGFLQRFLSIGDRLDDRDCGKGRGSISVSTGFLNVRDIFYTGSIAELPEYKENKFRFRSVSSLHSHSSFNRSNVPNILQSHQTERIEEEKDEEVEDSSESNEKQKQKQINGINSCHLLASKSISSEDDRSSSSRAIEIWRTVKRMLDLSLLTNPVYVLFGISNFLTSIGFNAPPMFMPMNAELVLGWDKIQASTTISAYGLANIFGRISFGLLCDRQLPTKWGKDKPRNRLWIYNLTLMFCGFITCFVFAINSFYAFIAYCFFYGFTISSYVCLTSVVLVDLVGVDRLTNAFGLLLFIQGIATFVGPPIAGKLFDLTNRYDWTFALCGICLFLSGAMLFVIPRFRNNEKYLNDKCSVLRIEMNGGDKLICNKGEEEK
uniref:Major facilitator superfamily (MFS) profile domain-containing protein n=1 Tax=Meloidogyne enterolobii TaxID=390850 RepID=A0A6V7WTX8_MELEN|nr:unnamed protein product [Meloidogyne enterolobii]